MYKQTVHVGRLCFTFIHLSVHIEFVSIHKLISTYAYSQTSLSQKSMGLRKNLRDLGGFEGKILQE